MGNEVVIEVSANNAAAAAVFQQTATQGAALGSKPVVVPVQAQLAYDQANGVGSLGEQIGKGPPVKVPVVADNPINEAFAAQVKASVRSISKDALDIPVEADLEPFQTQLEAVLAELAGTSKLDVPVDVGDGMVFRAQVQELVAQVEASTRAVISVAVDDGALGDLRTKTIAASEASLDLVAAEQKLNSAMTSGSDEAVAKARQDVVSASKQATEATEELEAAQAAAAEEARGVAEAEDVAAGSSRGLMAAMGPLFLVMTVAQLAMFAFGSSSSSTAQKAQDASQSIISLGQSAGQTAQSLVGGNAALQAMQASLVTVGTSATSFSQAYSGSVKQAQDYTNDLVTQQKNLGNTIANTGGQLAAFDGRPIKDFADNIKAADVSQLPDGLRQQVQQFLALNQVVPQASDALAGLKAAEQQQQETLAAMGYSMSAAAQATNDYGLTVENNAKAFMDATAGARYLEDSQDKATITAGQGIQAWHQLQDAVTSAGAAQEQAAESVKNAEHSVQTATDSVAAAKHGEEQATIAAGQAQRSYTNAVEQQRQAQEAVAAAIAATKQQLVELQLQNESAATSALSASDSVFQATQEASKLGVTPGNAKQIASEPENAGNAKQVEAAIALLQAEDQLAQAQNSSLQAQKDLNTARQEGVAKNPAVLSAEQALSQSQQGVKQASQGVANAQYAQQQATQQVSDAEYGLHQADQQVIQSQNAEAQASAAVKTAQDNASRSLNANTFAGAQNRQEIEQIYDAYVAIYGPGQKAASMTENVASKMGFEAGKVKDVINNLNGLNGKVAKTGITITPALDPSMLESAAKSLGVQFGPVGAALTTGGVHLTRAAGGPGSGLAWVGEQGPEIVKLPVGSTVYPHSNSMQMLASGQAPFPHFAAGGSVGSLASPMSALAANFPLAGQMGMADVVANSLFALGGGPAPKLPPPGTLDLGSLGFGGGGSHVSGNRAANKAIMQQVFAGYGWGSGAAWAAQDYLEMREAGYNNLAENPTSTAFGLGQFLDGTWASVGMSKTADPRLQSIGMAMYEGQRYGGPIGAAQHERAVNWYGYGGGANGLIGVGEHGPELLRVPNGSTVYPSANRQMMAAGGDTIAVTVVLDAGAGADGLMIGAIRQAVREGKINLRVVPGGKVVAG